MLGITLFDAFRGHALAPGGTDAPRPFQRTDALPIAALLGIHVTMFWRVLFTPAMFFFRDVFAYSYPHARFIREACLAGSIPYWNPTLNFGEPILANPNFLLFYPSTVLLVALPLDLGYTLHYVLHFMLAGVGTYGLARRWGQTRLAAFFAAFVFSLSGPVLSLGNFYNHAAAAAWIPWVLLVTDLALTSSSRRPWLLLSVIFALQFLASEPLTLMATFLICVAYALFVAGEGWLVTVANLRVFATFGVVGLLMLAVSAVALFPSLALLANSRRGVEGLPYLETTSWSLHPLQLMDLVVPDFFGSAVDSPTLWTHVLSSRNLPYLLSCFVGFVPLFLAFLGAIAAADRRRKFAAASAGLLLLLAFGRFTPVFSLAYFLFPPLGMVRFPVKLLIPALLFVAILAGWGADAIHSADEVRRNSLRKYSVVLKVFLGVIAVTFLTVFIAPSLITAPAGWVLRKTFEMYLRSPADVLTDAQIRGATEYLLRMLQIHLPGLAGFTLGGALWLHALEHRLPWARRAAPAVLVFAMAQLAWVTKDANPMVPRSFYTYSPPALQHFDTGGKPYRYVYVFREAPGGASADTQSFLNFETIPEASDIPPSAQIPFRDRLVLAKGSMLTPAEGVMNIDVERSFPIALYDFWVFALKVLDDPARTACLLGRTNVRYQVSKERVQHPTQREVAEIFNGSPDPHNLYENLCTLPRAFAAGKATVAATARDALLPLSDPNFDARGNVLIAAGSDNPTAGEEAGTAGEVEMLQYAPNEIVLRARMARPGYVVLLDRFDPSWHATLDGSEIRIFRANHLFRAVRVPAGDHEVRFYYQQRGLRSGIIVSVVALLFLLVVYFRR